MDDSKLSVNQIIEAIKMLTTSEYNEFVSRLASLQRPEDSIDVYIEEQRFSNGRVCPMCGSEKVVRNGRCIIRPIPVQFPEVLQGTSEA